jgi:hypothetical protein
MRKIGIIAVLALMVTALAAVPALAVNPHFTKASASGPNASGNLVVSFKIAGLGANETITVTTTGQASGQYACINRGGNHPQASNKEDFAGPVSASGDFTSDKNGNVTGSLTLTPPPTTLTCPGNQQLVLANVTYTDVSVSGGGDTAPISGTFTRTFFNV